MKPIPRRQPSPSGQQPVAVFGLLAAAAWALGGSGWSWWLFAALPLAYLLSAAVTLLAKVHDLRVHQLHAAGGALGVVMALLALLAGGGWAALVAGLLSAWVFVVAGRTALRFEPLYKGATEPEVRPAVAAKAAVDEALLSYFVGVAQIPAGPEADAMCAESARLEAAIKAGGWSDAPGPLYGTPTPPTGLTVLPQKYKGIAFDQFSYASAFRPNEALADIPSWMGEAANQRSVLRVFRHAGADRPWLLCIHGYRMGANWMDFGLFPPEVLHRKMGFNLLMPTLPLHGARKVGRKSGDQYLDGNLNNLFHAQTQALWDLRMALAWLRDREAKPKVGAYGISLGGYNAALLATVEAELDFVVAGVPLADPAGVLWRHLPTLHARYYAERGLTESRHRAILKPVSPLAQPALLPKERLHLFAAAADRIVPPDQPLLLSRHWDVPVTWYQGSHLSVRHERAARTVLKAAMQGAGWR